MQHYQSTWMAMVRSRKGTRIMLTKMLPDIISKIVSNIESDLTGYHIQYCILAPKVELHQFLLAFTVTTVTMQKIKRILQAPDSIKGFNRALCRTNCDLHNWHPPSFHTKFFSRNTGFYSNPKP